MIALLGLAGFVLPGQIPSGGGPPGALSVLPDRVAGYDPLTAGIANNPAGQALMLFNSGLGGTITRGQTLTLHTDGSSYRRVEAMDGPGVPDNRQALLSPDGNSILIAEALQATSEFRHLNLITGESRLIPLQNPAAVILHAWSPDGKSVAYGQAPWDRGKHLMTPDVAVRDSGVLTILDLPTGRSVTYPDVTPAAAASFGPGGDQVAVQVDDQIMVLNLPEGRRRTLGIRLPEVGLGIQPAVSWSPDGRWLALIAWRTNGNGVPEPMSETRSMTFGKLTFVDATGAGRLAPEPVQAGDLLGWRTPTSVLTLDQETGLIREFLLDTGEVKALSTMERPRTCELWTKTCKFSHVQVAADLLKSIKVEPAETPQRGPWPLWLQLVTAAATILFGFLVFRVVRRLTPGLRSDR
jgi:hypothetical protein